MRKKVRLGKIILLVVGVLLVVFVVVSFALINHYMKQYFNRSEQELYSEYMRWADYDDFERETVTFPSGDETLTGYIYGMDNLSKGLVVISHGLGGDSEGYISETKYFVDNGFMVFAYDNTGSGASTGDSCIGLVQSVIDLDNALTYVEQNPVFDGLPICLYGHSWGGFATTAILNYDHDIIAVASLAGYNDSLEEMTYVGKSLLGSFAYIEKPFIWLTLRATFGDRMKLTAANGINRAKHTAVMIIQGDLDDFVGFDGPCIYANRDKITREDVEFVLLEGREHGNLMMDHSEKRLAYMEQLNEEYNYMLEEYQNEIPDDIMKAWNNTIDKELTSRLDEELFEKIVAFYMEAIGE